MEVQLPRVDPITGIRAVPRPESWLLTREDTNVMVPLGETPVFSIEGRSALDVGLKAKGTAAAAVLADLTIKVYGWVGGTRTLVGQSVLNTAGEFEGRICTARGGFESWQVTVSSTTGYNNVPLKLTAAAYGTEPLPTSFVSFVGAAGELTLYPSHWTNTAQFYGTTLAAAIGGGIGTGTALYIRQVQGSSNTGTAVWVQLWENATIIEQMRVPGFGSFSLDCTEKRPSEQAVNDGRRIVVPSDFKLIVSSVPQVATPTLIADSIYATLQYRK